MELLDAHPGPQEAEVLPGGDGVPSVAAAGRRLPVSLSHAAPWAAGAASTSGRIGVDVEPARPLAGALTRYFLAPAEETALRAGWGHRATATLAGWTIKEAVLKAAGRGLSIPPRAATVHSLSPEGHVGAAVEGRPFGARCWREGDALVAVAWAGADFPQLAVTRSVL